MRRARSLIKRLLAAVYLHSFFKIRLLPSFGSFFQLPSGCNVEVGLVPLACCQHEAAIDDLPAGGIKNHDPLVTAARSEGGFFAPRPFRLTFQGEHASGILAAIAQDRIAPGHVGGGYGCRRRVFLGGGGRDGSEDVPAPLPERSFFCGAVCRTARW